MDQFPFDPYDSTIKPRGIPYWSRGKPSGEERLPPSAEKGKNSPVSPFSGAGYLTTGRYPCKIRGVSAPEGGVPAAGGGFLPIPTFGPSAGGPQTL